MIIRSLRQVSMKYLQWECRKENLLAATQPVPLVLKPASVRVLSQDLVRSTSRVCRSQLGRAPENEEPFPYHVKLQVGPIQKICPGWPNQTEGTCIKTCSQQDYLSYFVLFGQALQKVIKKTGAENHWHQAVWSAGC